MELARAPEHIVESLQWEEMDYASEEEDEDVQRRLPRPIFSGPATEYDIFGEDGEDTPSEPTGGADDDAQASIRPSVFHLDTKHATPSSRGMSTREPRAGERLRRDLAELAESAPDCVDDAGRPSDVLGKGQLVVIPSKLPRRPTATRKKMREREQLKVGGRVSVYYDAARAGPGERVGYYIGSVLEIKHKWVVVAYDDEDEPVEEKRGDVCIGELDDDEE